jgi:hypothetical protein
MVSYGLSFFDNEEKQAIRYQRDNQSKSMKDRP